MSLLDILENHHRQPTEIHTRTARIHARMLQTSRVIDDPNFQALSVDDLRWMFEQYDAEFFQGQLRPALGDCPMSFRMSRRLTSAAGKMTRRTQQHAARTPLSPATVHRHEYEICVSTTILFQSFTDPAARITASGLVCHNRLEALQRVFEHELIHLAEMVVWSDSSCAGTRFQSIAARLFGHREHTHRLVTSREHALKAYGVRVGDWAAFEFEGRRYQGHVNRVTRRATVLVEDPHGARYTDGKRYRKFYIPLPLLQRIDRSHQK